MFIAERTTIEMRSREACSSVSSGIRFAQLVVIASATVLLAAAPASASSVDRDVVGPGDVRYFFVGGESRNDVTVSRVRGGFRLEDAAGGLALSNADGDGDTSRCRLDDTEAAVTCPDDATFVDIALLGGDDTVTFVVDAAAYSGATYISGSGGDDTVTGGAGPDTISGGDGVDTIDGALGDDIIAPGLGDDGVVNGGEGFNELRFEDKSGFETRTAGVVVDLAAGGQTDGGPDDNPDPTRREDYVDFDNVTGTLFADVLRGDGAANALRGSGGDDTLVGRLGSDTLIGEAGSDTVSYEDRRETAGVTVTLDGIANDGASSETDALAADVENVSGGAGDDTLTGNDVANVLSGGGGADTLTGQAGADAFSGGPGDDILQTRDAIAEAVDCGAGADRATADAADALTGCESVDVLAAPIMGQGIDITAVDGPPSPPPGDCTVPASYPGDGAPQTMIARWMASVAGARGLPPELPIMAAIVQSGLRNAQLGQTAGGHADSAGFFQMRVGIWDKGEYAGYPQKPELQMKWFIDQASAVRTTRIAAGDAGFGLDPGKWGDWVADVERPAERLRLRYQLRLDEARQHIVAGCASLAGLLARPASEPLVSGLRLTPSRLRPARSGPSTTAVAGPAGARVSYALSFPAKVRFKLERAMSGRRVGAECRAAAASNLGRPTCTRTAPVRGGFTRGRPSGPDGFTFSGRIANRTLAPGRYLFVATPVTSRGSAEVGESSVWIRVAQPRAEATSGLPAGPKGAQVVAVARAYVGTPYLWGGTTPKTGFDCSGLVQWAHAEVGVRLARTAAEQYEAGTPVARRDLLPGDLVFFRDSTGGVGEVGISMGGDRFVGARPGDAVRVARLDDPFYAGLFAGGRRVAHPDR